MTMFVYSMIMFVYTMTMFICSMIMSVLYMTMFVYSMTMFIFMFVLAIYIAWKAGVATCSTPAGSRPLSALFSTSSTGQTGLRELDTRGAGLIRRTNTRSRASLMFRPNLKHKYMRPIWSSCLPSWSMTG